ncbi:hypothetical protein [Rickettsia endosymbiont of Pantilius tunicatus]|uniref:hypothetical protein n=1 Tax=Rickettsia endosymbiont of Pantilius tunicatus TaxID=3066267 RepID=UPI0030E56D5E
MKQKQFIQNGKINKSLVTFYNDLLKSNLLEQKGGFSITYKSISPDSKEAKIIIKEVDPISKEFKGNYEVSFYQESDAFLYHIIGNSKENMEVPGEVFNSL